MANINEILARAAALREETALNSISPERAGGIMYDTLMALNELWLQQGAALVISKIYASVDAMEADTNPVSDISGKPLRPGQIVVIASEDEDNGSVYRYNGTDSPSWSLVGNIGNLVPVDSLDSDSTQLPLAAHQGKVLDGKISQLGQKIDDNVSNVGNIIGFNNSNIRTGKAISSEAPNYPIVPYTNENIILSNFIPLGQNAYALVLRGTHWVSGNGVIRYSESQTDDGVAYHQTFESNLMSLTERVVLIPQNTGIKTNFATIVVERLSAGVTPSLDGSVTILSKVEYDAFVNVDNQFDSNVFNAQNIVYNKSVTDQNSVMDSNGFAISGLIKLPKNKTNAKLVYSGFLSEDDTILRARFNVYPFMSGNPQDGVTLSFTTPATGYGEIDLSNYAQYNYVIFTIYRKSGTPIVSIPNVNDIYIGFENIFNGIQDKQVFDITKVRKGYSIGDESINYAIVAVERNQILTNYIHIPSWAKSIKYCGIYGGGTIRARFAKTPQDNGDAIGIDMMASGTGTIDLRKIDISTYSYCTLCVYMDVADTIEDLSRVSIILSRKIIDNENVHTTIRNAWMEKPLLFVNKPKVVFMMDSYDGDINAYEQFFLTNGLKTSFVARPTLMSDIAYSHNVYERFERGHEILLHSDTDVNWNDGSTAPESHIRGTIVNYLNVFKQKGLPYPFGWLTMNGKIKDEFKPWVEDYMSYAAFNANLRAFDYSGDFSDITNVNATKYNYLRLCIDRYNSTDANIVSVVTNAIDACIANKGLLILYGHGYNEDGLVSQGIMSGIMSYLVAKINAGRCISGRADEMFDLHFR